ncbi:cation:proton antiporter subunit C [Alphaproteobacteria bacterium]|jgi:multicomponent Na+:H+ antiporter subunit C|nr:cation:proton antiporter subunit C [Alphaproteobacteria bacterium]MDB9871693.1 cation:proton antiporter subunit C [Alphaproteobacteria bacterium]
MITSAMGIWNYWIVFILMMIGLFIVIGRKNLLKKIIGLTIFQTSVFLLYITFGKITGGTAPILTEISSTIYSNPLPHVLILTAIVVGVATTALALALVVRINSIYGSIEEDDISAHDLIDYHDQNNTLKKSTLQNSK